MIVWLACGLEIVKSFSHGFIRAKRASWVALEKTLEAPYTTKVNSTILFLSSVRNNSALKYYSLHVLVVARTDGSNGISQTTRAPATAVATSARK